MMNLSVGNLMILVPPLLLLEGLFSGAEIALLSADRLLLKKQAKHGERGSQLALDLAHHPERVFSTTLMMTSLCVIATSSMIAIYFLQTQKAHAGLFAVLVTSPLVVLFGELIPKTIYQRNADRVAPWVAYPVHGAFWFFFPITRILASYTTRLSRIVGPIEELLSGHHKTTREQIQSLLSYSRSESEIKTSEKRMIKRIFDFRYTEAKHALIPLVQVDAIEDTANVQDALERFERHRHSRMPVFSSRVDNIIGILEVGDLLSATDLQQSIKLYITPAHYVSETQSLEDLLQEMRREDSEMVIVVDEHGGAVGVLTFEDIVEEIVGEIRDEFDPDSRAFKELSPNSWSLQARMEIKEINETLKLDLPEGDYETLSGFLLQQFGRIPEAGDELFFDTQGGSFRFTIKQATERHIETVLIQKLDR